MGSICAEQSHRQHHHKFHHLSAANKIHHHLYGLNIPPRKLSYCGTVSSDTAFDDFFSDSSLPKQAADKTSAPMQKILPCNGDSNREDGFDPYSSDQFRMFEFKVRRCARSRSHDWTDCPFAHPGEKARRRDPRKYHYSSNVCPEYRHGGCGRGDDCEHAHGVFECWLHPARYRTEMCKDGKNCKRKVCFFAHSSSELRIFLSQKDSESREGSKYENSTIKNITDHCCGYCSCSPPSTLLGMSHFSPSSLSPPVTPVKAAKGLSGSLPISRMGDWIAREGLWGAVTGWSAPVLDELALRGLSYKDVLNELIESFDGVNLNDCSWVNDLFNYDGDDHQQFVLSPSTPNTSGSTRKFSGFTANSSDSCSNNNIAINFDDKCNDSGLSGPDLGWVDDLLM